jgi:uncharacterized protein (AIM24 family)
MFRNHYTNRGSSVASVAITPSFPAKILPIDLSRSGTVYAHPGLYLAHLGEVRVTFRFVRGILAGCCGGGGFLMLKLVGSGTAFLMGGGTVMERALAAGEKLLVDTHSVLAFSASVSYGVQRVRGCTACCCGGEGLFNTELTGPGLVIVHSMALGRLRAAIGYSGGGGGNSGNSGDSSGVGSNA